MLLRVITASLFLLQLQDARSVLEKAARIMGTANLKSLEYSGSGATYTFGQAATP